MAVIEISVIPIGSKTSSVSNYISRALKELEGVKNIKYQLTPMGTVIEGDLDKILDMAIKMHKAVFNKNIKRVVTIMKIDERTDKKLTMEGKIKSIKNSFNG